MLTSDIPAALEEVMTKHPKLHCGGYGLFRGMTRDLAQSRQDLRSGVNEVATALNYLGPLPRRMRAAGANPSSYHLKHLAEKSVGGYVSNGALIAAALILGVKVRISPDSPNPGVLVDLDGCRDGSWSLAAVARPRSQADKTSPAASPAQDFLKTMVDQQILAFEPDARCLVGDLYALYLQWRHGSGEAPMGVRKFGQALADLGFESMRGAGGVRMRGGLRIL